MALTVLAFQVLSFTKSYHWLHCQWWVASSSLDLNPLDHHVRGNAEVLSQVTTRLTAADLVCLARENHNNAVKDFRKRLQECLSAKVEILNIKC